MKNITLSQGKFAMVDDADFEYLNQWKWYAEKKERGQWYAARKPWSTGQNIKMHRVIVKAKKGQKVDHWDGDGLNNQRSNLRLASKSQNAANRNKGSNNTSGYKGVTYDKINHKWISQLTHNYKNIRIGRFNDIVDAAKAYDKAARKYFGEFARLNFPSKQ